MPVDPAAVVQLRSRQFTWPEVAHELKCSVGAARRAADKAAGSAGRQPARQEPRPAGRAATGQGAADHPDAAMLESLRVIVDSPDAKPRQKLASTRVLLRVLFLHFTGHVLAAEQIGKAVADYIVCGILPADVPDEDG